MERNCLDAPQPREPNDVLCIMKCPKEVGYSGVNRKLMTHSGL